MCIGRSTHNPSQAATAIKEGADLIGFGPVFTTQTKQNLDACVGTRTLRKVVKHSAIPVVAIGGINPSNIESVMTAQPGYIACISAITKAEFPAEVTRQLHNRVAVSPNTHARRSILSSKNRIVLSSEAPSALVTNVAVASSEVFSAS